MITVLVTIRKLALTLTSTMKVVIRMARMMMMMTMMTVKMMLGLLLLSFLCSLLLLASHTVVALVTGCSLTNGEELEDNLGPRRLMA